MSDTDRLTEIESFDADSDAHTERGSVSNPNPPSADPTDPGHAGGNNGNNDGNNGDNPTPGSGDDGLGRVQDLQIERELKDSYLTYAMSTIMDRALPDVRDGLKPSQRRILVAMNDLGLKPGKKHLKCAKICGDTSGNYHPHGESVIYPTMVGLAQTWRMRVPLVAPQGNFGSIDGDPPAAMRYTEARMTAAAVDMLEDLSLDTVDMQPNYDDRLMEPTVLPGKFPNLLINGGVGIAVGMATSLAPHNPLEVFDSIVRVLDKPDISLGELMADAKDPNDENSITRRGIKGPDFPTGGLIIGRAGIVEAYATGRGKVTVRGTVHTEEHNGRTSLVIDTIPYALVQTTLMERLVDAVREERIRDVSDVRNESGREAQTRIVIELKKGAEPAVVENQLYQFTPLQQTFSIHNIALVNRQPRTLSLREMIAYYIEHRVVVIRRRTAHLLREAKKRAHILEGLILAVCDIDEVIRLIRTSRTRTEAIDRLVERGFRIAPDHRHAALIPERLLRATRDAEARGGLRLTRVQAEAIGAMRLIQLVGLEVERLAREYREVLASIDEYEAILADRKRVEAIIRDDCESMRAVYASGAKAQRLTRIEDGEGVINLEELIQEHAVTVTISHAGYAKRVALNTYRQQGRGGKGIIASTSKDDDFIEHMFCASSHDDLLCFTDLGRVFKIKVYELPEMSRQSKGQPIVNLIELRNGERCCAFLAVRNFEEGSHFLTFVSRAGIVKRTPLKDYRNVNRSGIIAVGLKEDDSLLSVTLTSGSDDLLLATSAGMAIRFCEEQVRLMGRAAAGVKGIELADDNRVIGVVRIPMELDEQDHPVTAAAELNANLCLLTVTENGYGKRTGIDEYRVKPEVGKLRSQSRGGKGRADITTSERNGNAVAACPVRQDDDVIVVTRSGMLVRVAAASIRETGRGAQGVRVVSLNPGDAVVAVTPVVDRDEDDTAPPNGNKPEAPTV